MTINQRMQLRTTDIARARKAVAEQFDLVRARRARCRKDRR